MDSGREAEDSWLVGLSEERGNQTSSEGTSRPVIYSDPGERQCVTTPPASPLSTCPSLQLPGRWAAIRSLAVRSMATRHHVRFIACDALLRCRPECSDWIRYPSGHWGRPHRVKNRLTPTLNPRPLWGAFAAGPSSGLVQNPVLIWQSQPDGRISRSGVFYLAHSSALRGCAYICVIHHSPAWQGLLLLRRFARISMSSLRAKNQNKETYDGSLPFQQPKSAQARILQFVW